MKVIGIIPARLGSSRLTNKPLIQITNKTLIQLTYEAVQNSGLFDSIFITTDSNTIKNHTKNFGAKCILTSQENRNGTERCIELIEKLQYKIDDNTLIINIQCDEPFLKKTHFQKIIDLFSNENVTIGTLISPLETEDLNDSSVVKVNINEKCIAKQFSRFTNKFNKREKLYKHIGIYAYRKDTLFSLKQLEVTKSELTESLEQLRWVDHNFNIHCSITLDNLISINTKTDLKKVLKM